MNLSWRSLYERACTALAQWLHPARPIRAFIDNRSDWTPDVTPKILGATFFTDGMQIGEASCQFTLAGDEGAFVMQNGDRCLCYIDEVRISDETNVLFVLRLAVEISLRQHDTLSIPLGVIAF